MGDSFEGLHIILLPPIRFGGFEKKVFFRFPTSVDMLWRNAPFFPRFPLKCGAALGETGNKFLARNQKSAVFLEAAPAPFPRIAKNIKTKTSPGPNGPPLFSRHFALNSTTSLPNQLRAGLVAKIRGGETSVSRGA